MALTLAELQAKRDGIVRDIEVASVRFADGRQKDFIQDKRKTLALLDEQIAAATSGNRLRRTVVRTVKGW